MMLQPWAEAAGRCSLKRVPAAGCRALQLCCDVHIWCLLKNLATSIFAVDACGVHGYLVCVVQA